MPICITSSQQSISAEQWVTKAKKRPYKVPLPKAPDNEQMLHFQCMRCRRPWQNTADQAAWCIHHSMQVPKRCQECRNSLRERKKNNIPQAATEARTIQHARLPAKSWDQISPNLAPPSNKTSRHTASKNISGETQFLSSCSDQSAEYNQPLLGRFWSSSNSRSKPSFVSPTTSPKRLQGHLDQTEINAATYDTPQEQEQLLDPPEYPEAPSLTRANAENISKPLNALVFDFPYHIFFPYPTHISWHVKARPDMHQALCDTVLKHQAIQLNETNPSEPPGFPGFDVPDIEAPIHDSGLFSPSNVSGHSDRWADMLSDSESEQDSESQLPSLQSSSSSEEALATDAIAYREEQSHSSNTPSADCKADNIFAVLASLCTNYDLKAIKNLHQFSPDSEWIARGPDGTPNNLIDICFDVFPSTPALIQHLRSSQVPHTTVQTLTKVKASAEYQDMQSVCHRLLDQGHWPVFQAEAFSVLKN